MVDKNLLIRIHEQLVEHQWNVIVSYDPSLGCSACKGDEPDHLNGCHYVALMNEVKALIDAEVPRA